MKPYQRGDVVIIDVGQGRNQIPAFQKGETDQ